MNALSARYDGESLDVSTSMIRNKMRLAFVEQEKVEILGRIKDLETTLAINKQVIKDLCDATLSASSKNKNVITRLNDENMMLHRSVKVLTKQRDDAEAKLLVCTQMLEEYKHKEAEQAIEWKETLVELRDQLNKKEYLLQVAEKRYQDMENIVLKYLKNIPEVKVQVFQIRSFPRSNVGITNVVVENQQLVAKLSEALAEIARLRKELESSEAHVLANVLKDKISQLVKENESQRQKMDAQEKRNMELYELNEKLSSQLENLNKQVNVLVHSQKIMHTEILHTKEQTGNQYYTQGVQPEKAGGTNRPDMSFGHLSSISGEMYDEPQEASFPENLRDERDIEKEVKVGFGEAKKEEETPPQGREEIVAAENDHVFAQDEPVTAESAVPAEKKTIEGETGTK